MTYGAFADRGAPIARLVTSTKKFEPYPVDARRFRRLAESAGYHQNPAQPERPFTIGLPSGRRARARGSDALCVRDGPPR